MIVFFHMPTVVSRQNRFSRATAGGVKLPPVWELLPRHIHGRSSNPSILGMVLDEFFEMVIQITSHVKMLCFHKSALFKIKKKRANWILLKSRKFTFNLSKPYPGYTQGVPESSHVFQAHIRSIHMATPTSL